MKPRGIYFILCPSYHGATLLSKLLNAHPDMASLGDTLPSTLFDQTCGCRQKVSQCSFWQTTKDGLGSSLQERGVAWLGNYPGQLTVRKRIYFSEYAPFFSPRNIRTVRNAFSSSDIMEFRQGFERFISALPPEEDLFVDGVKSANRVASLAAAGLKIDGIIHLKRNPRDFVASSFKNTGRKGLFGTIEHALRWRHYHKKVEALGNWIPSLTLTYEDLATETDASLSRIFSFMGSYPLSVSDLAGKLQQEWHFIGNSSLFQFDGTFKLSTHTLPKWQSAIVRLIAGKYERGAG